MADALAARWHLPRWSRVGNAKSTSGQTDAGKVHLLKPNTFMNDSGKALRGLRASTPDDVIPDLIVLVDDIHTPLGSFRLRAAGSSGGHNGLKSIEAQLGTRNYARLRVGIGPKPEGADQAEWVLDEMPHEERRIVAELMPVMCDAVSCWAERGIEKAMSAYNHRAPPAEDA